MKKLIIFNLIFILCLFFIFSTDSFASGDAIKDYFESPNSTLEFEKASSQIYTILRTFAFALAVCIMVTISISYMVSTPNKRAILKERLIYYVCGVIFLVGCVGFLGWYERVANDVASTITGGNIGAHAINYEPQKEIVNNLSKEIRSLDKQIREAYTEYEDLEKAFNENGNVLDPNDPYKDALHKKWDEIQQLEEKRDNLQEEYDYHYSYLQDKYYEQN